MRSISLSGSRVGPRPEEPSSFRRFGNVHVGPLVASVLLALIGLLTVSSSAVEQSQGVVTKQIVWVIAGIVVLFALMLFDYHFLVNVSLTFYVAGLAALTLVLLVGHEAGGARSWFNLGAFSIQPSEFHKIATVLLLTRYLSRLRREYLTSREILITIGIAALPIGLIVLQRDMGSAAMYIPMLLGMLLVSGVRQRQVIVALVLGGVLVLGYWTFGIKDYQKARIVSYLSPDADPQGSGYQARQSKIAVGSGQLTGRGWGQGTQSQLRFLPARHSDFVIAVLAEERGFLGVLTVLGLYALFITSAAQIAMRSRDRAGILLVVGLVSVMAAHMIYNTAMVVGLLPITGIPLPFVSYGGSFMIFNFIATSLILNVDLRRYVNR